MWRKRMKESTKTLLNRLLLRWQVCACCQLNVKPFTCKILIHFNVFFPATDNDYEDLTCGQQAVAIYDYEGGLTLNSPFSPHLIIISQHSWGQILSFPPPHRGWWRDLLHPGRHHHQHRDDRRGLVEGTVSRTHRPVPGRVRPADAVSDMLGERLHKLHFCTIADFLGCSTEENEFIKINLCQNGFWSADFYTYAV